MNENSVKQWTVAGKSNGEISVEEREETSRNLDPRMHCARSRRLAAVRGYGTEE